jgi:hypothetical protein
MRPLIFAYLTSIGIAACLAPIHAAKLVRQHDDGSAAWQQREQARVCAIDSAHCDPEPPALCETDSECMLHCPPPADDPDCDGGPQ